jgi:hypothetical protein
LSRLEKGSRGSRTDRGSRGGREFGGCWLVGPIEEAEEAESLRFVGRSGRERVETERVAQKGAETDRLLRST